MLSMINAPHGHPIFMFHPTDGAHRETRPAGTTPYESLFSDPERSHS